MSACEKCWARAGGDVDEYHRLLATVSVPECTPEEQAGPDAGTCPVCQRRTLHQHTRECMADFTHTLRRDGTHRPPRASQEPTP